MRRFAMFFVAVLLAVAAAPQFAQGQGYDPDQAAPKPIHNADTVYVKAAPDTQAAQNLPSWYRFGEVFSGESTLATGLSLTGGIVSADSAEQILTVFQHEQAVVFAGGLLHNKTGHFQSTLYLAGFVGIWQKAAQAGPYVVAQTETDVDPRTTLSVSSVWWPCFLAKVPSGYEHPAAESVRLFANYGDLMVDVARNYGDKWGKASVGAGLSGLKYLNQPGDAQWVARGRWQPPKSSAAVFGSLTYTMNGKKSMLGIGVSVWQPRKAPASLAKN